MEIRNFYTSEKFRHESLWKIVSNIEPFKYQRQIDLREEKITTKIRQTERKKMPQKLPEENPPKLKSQRKWTCTDL